MITHEDSLKAIGKVTDYVKSQSRPLESIRSYKFGISTPHKHFSTYGVDKLLSCWILAAVFGESRIVVGGLHAHALEVSAV